MQNPEPQHYFPSMDLAAREGKVLDHPLCNYCPVTAAAAVTRATNSEGYAIWSLECFSLLGRSLLKNGEIQETISNGCVQTAPTSAGQSGLSSFVRTYRSSA